MKTKQNKAEILYNAAKFSIPQTAEILGVGPDTILREIDVGKLQAQWRGKRMKCSQAAIDDYIDNQKVAVGGEVDDYEYKNIVY